MLFVAPATAVGIVFVPMLLLMNCLTPNPGIFFGEAQQQYYNICDSSRLSLCQREALRDIQSSGAAQIGQYQLSNGPPYSSNQISPHSSSGYASVATCRLVRNNLDCLLMTTPACYNQGLPAAMNTDVILRAKRFLETNQCNQPDLTWQNSYCYKSPDVRSCEERHGFATNSPSASSYLASAPNHHSCQNYQSFRQCVEQYVRFSCKNSELDMLNEYLIDEASDLAWRCVSNSTNGIYSNNGQYNTNNNYGLSQYPNTILSPQQPPHYNGGFEPQRPMLPYYGSSGNSMQSRDRPWEKYRDPFKDNGYPYDGSLSRLPPSMMNDRLTMGTYDPIDLQSDCPNRAAPFTRECEETLVENHRAARDSRNGNEIQRRICCSLYQFRDCISRVVLDRCTDSSPTAVDILMSTKKRDIVYSCRDFSRDVCSGSQQVATISSVLMALASMMASFMALKSSSLSCNW